MVRFSCFQAHSHSDKQKKIGRLSAEAMKKTLENALEKNKSGLEEEGDALDDKSDSSPVNKNSQIRKSQSLGSGLNSKDRTFGSDHSDDHSDDDDDVDHNNASCDGSAKDDQELIESDSIRLNSNFATNESCLSGSDDSGVCTPRIVKSTSLPSITTSPVQYSSSSFPCSKSLGDLNALDSEKIPVVADAVNMEKIEDELPTKGLRLTRIEEWVFDHQHCRSPEGSNALLEEPSSKKMEVKVNPGAEAATRYITSLNASATAAQLTNLGLVVIPFLSAFVSLKVVNLSGNSIARITSGALPRGLHILNLSKNHISAIEGLRDLTRLRVLDLSYNRILRIGHGLAGCSSIKELYLAGNKISEVEGLHRLLKLSVLDLRFNKISTTKCLGQLAANYSCLQSLSLEGNPAQKNVGDEQLKKYAQSLLPQLTYYNTQSIKIGAVKDIGRGSRVEVKSTTRRKIQVAASQRSSRSRRGAVAPGGVKAATNGNQFGDFGRSRSEGTLETV
ncbi:hypothetical protein MIMGU_mgv1a004952mg [Erythranthe guttata]|uniref:U2A'/phosphoprotein 32 family A C-terminal domain-containing protein n=1 Tax=Erythranthe guttata TaxID=4155 RepID=A0A022QC48_ERYGU|nr:hypothetical protein MIMGU_mgv1a004952mg [Erythranthe guttata]